MTNIHAGTSFESFIKESEGVKFDNGKPPMELLSHHALTEIAKVFAFGASKYGKWNYKGGMDWGRVIGAAYRHLGAFNAGEDTDLESGLNHISHLGCCVVMLLDYIKDHPELDTRYKSSKADAPKESETVKMPKEWVSTWDPNDVTTTETKE